METKKISFGFMKTKKAEKPVVKEKKDFIECVEEKSIKVIGGDEIKEETPLIIPMKPNTLVTAERFKEIAEKVESALEEPEIVQTPAVPQEVPENETLDQMVVRELLQDAKKEVNVETSALTVPLPAKPVNEGEKESTLDDYEAVPVQDFGLAMLRGMGWAPNKEKSTYKQPQLRPKGLGLGADKVVKDNQKKKPVKDSKGEDLIIVKNAYVKITTGKHSGYYGKIVSLDEDTGRAMVDIAVKKEMVSLSEFMMQPVTKAEFDKESKVINVGSYEEYKKKEALQKTSRNTEEKDRKEDKSEIEGTSSRSGESKHDRDEKSSRNVVKKYERDEKSSRKIDSKNERDEKSSQNDESKYEKDNMSSKEMDKNTKNGKGYKDDDKKERDRNRSHRKQRKDSTEERSSRKNKRHSSSESLESLSDSERRNKQKDKRHSSLDSPESDRDRKKKSKRKERRRHDSNDSESDHRSKRNKTPEGKRDIDKKRKGKKKKRDRDRSPNYRKHRK